MDVEGPKTPGPAEATGAPAPEVDVPPPSSMERFAQGIALSAGLALLGAGAVAAFLAVEGTSTAALLITGLALLVIAYIGRYITTIKIKELTIELDQRVRAIARSTELLANQAQETVSLLRQARDSLDPAVLDLPSGGRKDVERDEFVEQQMRAARTTDVDGARLRGLLDSQDEVDRWQLLAVLRVRPELRTADLLITAIERAVGGYDRDRFMVLAAEALHTMTDADLRRLRSVVENQRGSLYSSAQIQWETSSRLLRLIGRIERDGGSRVAAR